MELTLRQGQGLLFKAIPSDGVIKVRSGHNGAPNACWPNTAVFSPKTEHYLQENSKTVWFSREANIKIRGVSWIVNSLGDPDEYPEALSALDRFANGKAPVLNHPRAICLARRDLSAQVLAEVEGLEVPECLRIIPEKIEDFQTAFQNSNLTYPVLVRPAKSQSGQGLLRLESDEDWQKLEGTNWFRVPHFITQFVDTRLASGEYMKARVVFVGGVSFVRHVKASGNWKIHNEDGYAIEGFQSREALLIKALVEHEGFRAICKALPLATGLDYFGLDIGIDLKQGRFVLFEANPSMSIFFPDAPELSPSRLKRKQSLEQPIETALLALLQRPGHWGRFLPETLRKPENTFDHLYTKGFV